ncbi:MAG TPA: tetratricopeptide repeat protein, partial [Thermoanaerobaculia bacterium]|nr:tetratricopeptide repeat protein [Thermoanaerobaculia bacterium]
FARQGRPDAAVEEIERCLDVDPTYVAALWNLAVLERGAEDGVGAVFERLARALAVDPTSAQLRMLRGDLLLDSQRFGEAEAAYRSVLEVAPRSADAWANLARALVALGKRREAQDAAGAALAIDPSHAAARELRRDLDARP